MAAFRAFEIEAICLMMADVFSPAQIDLLSKMDQPKSYEYTGSGYFLTVEDVSFPIRRSTHSEPAVVGTAGDVQAGFVVFLGEQELTLECHTWGAVDVPEDFRDLPVAISTPPVNFVDLRNAT